MKHFLFIFTLLFGTAVFVNALSAADKPNIVLIMADDFGYETVGANGGTSYPTPNIDKLAANGVRFTHCYVQPLCTPTRTQLMTGKYNVRNYTVFGRLERTQKTFGNFFKDAGYTTGVFGKWQLGAEPDSPKHFGFDTFVLWHHIVRQGRYANPKIAYQGELVEHKNGEYGPKIFGDAAVKFIEDNKDKPFFLYFPMTLTHNPWQPTPDSADWDPKRADDTSGGPKYFKDNTEYLDKNVGRIVEKLKETGLTEKTLIIFLGDNGTGRGITSQLNGKPYAGGKGSTKESGMHVPLVVSLPGKIKSGVVNNNLVDSTDFLPTIAEIAGITLPNDAERDGISFAPQLTGKESKPREWIYSWFLGLRPAGQESVFAFDKQYKLYRNGAFYNTANDPDETKPLDVNTLDEEQKTALKKLQNVLDNYKDARPDWATKLEKTAPVKENNKRRNK